jgi:hypothetical protein
MLIIYGDSTWMGRSGEEIFLSKNVLTDPGAQPVSNSMVTGLFPGGKVAGACNWTRLHLAPMLRMSGAIPRLPLYVVMAWTRTTVFIWQRL